MATSLGEHRARYCRAWSGQNRPVSILTRSAKSPNLDPAPRESGPLRLPPAPGQPERFLDHLVDGLLKQALIRLGSGCTVGNRGRKVEVTI
jgi:hypothetical protein